MVGFRGGGKSVDRPAAAAAGLDVYCRLLRTDSARARHTSRQPPLSAGRDGRRDRDRRVHARGYGRVRRHGGPAGAAGTGATRRVDPFPRGTARCLGRYDRGRGVPYEVTIFGILLTAPLVMVNVKFILARSLSRQRGTVMVSTVLVLGGPALGAMVACVALGLSMFASSILFWVAGTSWQADGMSFLPGAVLLTAPLAVLAARQLIRPGQLASSNHQAHPASEGDLRDDARGNRAGVSPLRQVSQEHRERRTRSWPAARPTRGRRLGPCPADRLRGL